MPPRIIDWGTWTTEPVRWNTDENIVATITYPKVEVHCDTDGNVTTANATGWYTPAVDCDTDGDAIATTGWDPEEIRYQAYLENWHMNLHKKDEKMRKFDTCGIEDWDNATAEERKNFFDANRLNTATLYHLGDTLHVRKDILEEESCYGVSCNTEMQKYDAVTINNGGPRSYRTEGNDWAWQDWMFEETIQFAFPPVKDVDFKIDTEQYMKLLRG